jgi:hypothetical protein
MIDLAAQLPVAVLSGLLGSRPGQPPTGRTTPPECPDDLATRRVTISPASRYHPNPIDM